MTYIPRRLRDDEYETRHETDEGDRVRDWPNSQDTDGSAWFDDAAGEAVEDGWLQREVERVAGRLEALSRQMKEERLGWITRQRGRGKEGEKRGEGT